MSQEYITISSARENNLKNVSLRIPKRKITLFTGVSGSGKSSIVFDTIAFEARRQLNETFSTFARNFLPRYAQPDTDAIEPNYWLVLRHPSRSRRVRRCRTWRMPPNVVVTRPIHRVPSALIQGCTQWQDEDRVLVEDTPLRRASYSHARMK